MIDTCKLAGQTHSRLRRMRGATGMAKDSTGHLLVLITTCLSRVQIDIVTVEELAATMVAATMIMHHHMHKIGHSNLIAAMMHILDRGQASEARPIVMHRQTHAHMMTRGGAETGRQQGTADPHPMLTGIIHIQNGLHPMLTGLLHMLKGDRRMLKGHPMQPDLTLCMSSLAGWKSQHTGHYLRKITFQLWTKPCFHPRLPQPGVSLAAGLVSLQAFLTAEHQRIWSVRLLMQSLTELLLLVKRYFVNIREPIRALVPSLCSLAKAVSVWCRLQLV